MVNLKIKLPPNFLDEETRCGFTVSKKMKEVWAVELDLLAEFDRVCQKHGIKYIASGGTMLGAVRHHGYIPWDDDVDLMMMRDEYDKLCKIGPTEFKHPYFFQTEETDPGFMRYFARLRNSETTGIQECEVSSHFKFNQGIFIDIFPMDAICDDIELFKKQSKEAQDVRRKIFEACRWGHYLLYTDTVGYKVKKYFILPLFGKLIEKHFNIHDLFVKHVEITKRYNNDNTKYVSLLGFQFDNDAHYIKRKDMEKTIDVDFEFMKIPIIVNYDEALKWKYGDYKVFVKAPNYHGDMIFDTDISYKEYFKRHR